MDTNVPRATVNVVFSSDDGYVQHLGVALASLLKNIDSERTVQVFVLTQGISESNQQLLASLDVIKPFLLEFITVDASMLDIFPNNRKHISIATYFRLLIPLVVPASVNKVLYLDSDIVCTDDVSLLYDTDIHGFDAAVCEDEGSREQVQRLGLPEAHNYFNAGVILFNVERLRSRDFLSQCRHYYRVNQEKILFQDQDILNGVLNGLCLFLPLRWNAHARLYTRSSLPRFATPKEEAAARSNPGIIHYTDYKKPWKLTCIHPRQKDYFFYVALTPWKDQKKKYTVWLPVRWGVRFLTALKQAAKFILRRPPYGN